MPILLLILISFVLKQNLHAERVGCATIYERSLCETAENVDYKSDIVSWQMSKSSLKDRLIELAKVKLPNSNPKMGAVFLWVNDFNSYSSLRVQFWEETSSYILDIPVDINAKDVESNINLRIAGTTPYPLDFGYSPGELLVYCSGICTDEHRFWLLGKGYKDIKILMPQILIIKVPWFREFYIIQQLLSESDFQPQFLGVEKSPVIEGNGFRELAFFMFF